MSNEKKYAILLEDQTMKVINFPKHLEEDVKERLEYYYEKLECDTVDIVSAFEYENEKVCGSEGKFCLIVDDEGLLKENTVNLYASLAYGFHLHKQYIMGKALILQDRLTEDGKISCGLTKEDVDTFRKAVFNIINKISVKSK